MTFREAYKIGTEELAAAGIEEASLDEIGRAHV